MKRYLFALFSLPVLATAQITPPHMVRQPDIHGDQVVYCAEGDLWLGSLGNHTSQRITTHEGNESNPRFSPDGETIAFTAQYDGAADVYVMPVDGGAPKRLTYDPTGATMVCWAPDGESILFRSGRGSAFGVRLYSVSIKGGPPKVLPMEKAAQADYSPDGKKLAYVRLAMESHRWKRYHGGEANNIFIADLPNNKFRRINKEVVNEQYPTWAGNDIFYISEKDGSANLWKYDTTNGQSKRLTNHIGVDVKAPSTDGQKVIYSFGNELWTYDIASGKEAMVSLAMNGDRIHTRPHYVQGGIGTFAIGPTGKRVVVEDRGQLFTLGAEKGEVRPIFNQLGSLSKASTWSPDGKWIAFVSDRTGEENIYIAPASGVGEPKVLTNESKMPLDGLLWSPDSKKLIFTDFTDAVYLLDIETKVKTLVSRSGYGGSEYSFSPDSKWIALSKPENIFVSSLYLYNLADKKSTRLTQPPFRDGDPVFDPAGKYLYFVSQRAVAPSYDGFDFQMNIIDTGKLYLFTLAKDTPAPQSVDSDEEPEGAAAKKEEVKQAATETKIDLDGIQDRLIELPLRGGSYGNLRGLPGKLLFVSSTGTSRGIKMLTLDTGKVTDISPSFAFDLSADLKKIAVVGGGGVQIGDAGAPLSGGAAVDTSGFTVPIDPVSEWHEIFMQAWRNQRDKFYDPNHHGQDMDVLRKRYEALLPAVGSRSELNEILGELIGEMNVSHEFVGGGYSRVHLESVPPIGFLGADLEFDAASKAYKITHILKGDGFESTARSPLLTPGLNIKDGTYLLAIDGQPLKPDQDPNALLVGQSGTTVALQINDTPSATGARTIRVKTMRTDRRGRYFDWVAKQREYVAKNGGPNIAYIHIPDMGAGGITEFSKQFYANLDKDGIVLDVRYNGGGIVSGMILERLRRIIFEYDQPRYGEPQPYHRNGILSKFVVLCNENTGSDGEYFCTGFKMMGLGQTVGMRTWGGFMAVNGFPMIDGGSVSTPVQGSFAPNGTWLPDGTGFTPDFEVPEDPNAFAMGRDAQMDKALELLKEAIRKDPPKWPKRIDPPSKDKAFGPNKGGK